MKSPSWLSRINTGPPEAWITVETLSGPPGPSFASKTTVCVTTCSEVGVQGETAAAVVVGEDGSGRQGTRGELTAPLVRRVAR